jgi:hypothetical protein
MEPWPARRLANQMSCSELRKVRDAIDENSCRRGSQRLSWGALKSSAAPVAVQRIKAEMTRANKADA